MSQAAYILIALIFGLLAGILANAIDPQMADVAIAFTRPVGSAWLHGLQMVIVPLIVGLLITGVGAVAESTRAGRIALRSVITFVTILWTVSLMSALFVPFLLELWALPPAWAQAIRLGLSGAPPVADPPSIAAFFENIIPSNVVAAAANNSFLSLTLFSVALAFAIASLPAEKRARLTAFFEALNDALLIIIGWVLKVAPIGIFALAYSTGVSTGASAFGALLHYIIIVSSVGFVILLASYGVAVIGGKVPLRRFARAVAPAQAIALSTQSSLASLPTMLDAATRLGAPHASAAIILPLAVAIFRATSPAMNLAVAIYVAHIMNVPLGPGQLAAGIATAAITTMGSVSLPGTISFIASVAPVSLAMGVPIEVLGLLIAVETVPDLFRTVGNVTMDTAVTISIARHDGGDSREPSPLQQ